MFPQSLQQCVELFDQACHVSCIRNRCATGPYYLLVANFIVACDIHIPVDADIARRADGDFGY